MGKDYGHFDYMEQYARDWRKSQHEKLKRIQNTIHDPNREKYVFAFVDSSFYLNPLVSLESLRTQMLDVKTSNYVDDELRQAYSAMHKKLERYAQLIINGCNQRHHKMDAKRLKSLYQITQVMTRLGMTFYLSRWMSHNFILNKLTS